MPLKKKFLAFLFVVILIITLLTYQGIKGSAGFYSAFDFFIFPLKGLELASSSMSSGIKNLFERYSPGSGKAYEIRNLREKIRELEQVENKFAETQAENKRLRDLLELKSGRQDYVTSARVIARDPANWFQILWINKGSEKGIIKDMVAVTASGIVGRVHRVLKDTANIIQITDVNSSVAVRFQSLNLEGILEGKGTDRCIVKYVPQEEEVSVGEIVITSGLDGIYPEGLQAGYVSKVIKKGYGLFQYIEVIPMQNLSKAREVSILKKVNSE